MFSGNVRIERLKLHYMAGLGREVRNVLIFSVSYSGRTPPVHPLYRSYSPPERHPSGSGETSDDRLPSADFCHVRDIVPVLSVSYPVRCGGTVVERAYFRVSAWLYRQRAYSVISFVREIGQYRASAVGVHSKGGRAAVRLPDQGAITTVSSGVCGRILAGGGWCHPQ